MKINEVLYVLNIMSSKSGVYFIDVAHLMWTSPRSSAWQSHQIGLNGGRGVYLGLDNELN